MAKREQAKPGPQLATKELEQFKRLVELQGQLVELARQNTHAGKECDALWRKLATAPRPAQVPGASLSRVLVRLRQLTPAEIANRFIALVRAAQIVSKPAAK